MPSVRDVIERLLPNGTGGGRTKNWKRCPAWPPDLFAVTGVLVEMSGCYSGRRYAGGAGRGAFFGPRYLKEVTRAGGAWRRKATVPREAQRHWERLLKAGKGVDVATRGAEAQKWSDAALSLLAIADEASAGIGFWSAHRSGWPFVNFLLDLHLQLREGGPLADPGLPKVPISLCMEVSPQEVCVQPKTRTPQVGCTLRSLTHNLALLPPAGHVATSWMIAHPKGRRAASLNLLLVPFPFRVEGQCFAAAKGGNKKGPRFFDLEQRWLNDLSPADIAELLADLIRAARNEVGPVHGVVLPEGTLRADWMEEISATLAAETELELFIAGTLGGDGTSNPPRNSVYGAVFYKHAVLDDWMQSKHHRWKLDYGQITRYHLGHALSPERPWWENVDVSDRRLVFYVFRHGASLATLICEDLGRIDPVQSVVRAVGPNLVVALLMDGPQFKWRWPGRYATVLADDPGCAVLTLTCFGMVRRSAMPGDSVEPVVALWKDPLGEVIELKLPKGAHGLVLTLSQHNEENFTLDGRSDEGSTVSLSLTGVHAVAARDASKALRNGID
jgi:hypothetical protein